MRPCVCRFQTWGRACLLCFCMCTTAWVLFHGPIPRSLLGGLRGRPLPEGACCSPRTRRTRSPAASWDTRWPRGTGPGSAPLSAGLPPDPQGYREWEGAWLVLTWPHMQEVSHDTFPQGSQASVSPLHSMGPKTQAWVARSTACPPCRRGSSFADSGRGPSPRSGLYDSLTDVLGHWHFMQLWFLGAKLL